MRKLVQIVTALLIANVHIAMAQWTSQATGYTAPSRGVRNISIADENTVWISSYDGSGAQLNTSDFGRTTDGGTTWTPGTITDAAGMGFSNITAVDGNTAWASFYGTAGGGKIYNTTDGGTTWTHQTTATFTAPAGFPNLVHFFDASNGFCQGDPNGGYFEIYTTADGGTTWTRVIQDSIPDPIAADEYGIVSLYTTYGEKIWFGTTKGRVYYSSDNGKSWSVGSTGLVQITSLAFKDADNGLAFYSTTKQFANTTDGGATWSLVTPTGAVLSNQIVHIPGTNAYVMSGAAAGFYGSSVSTDDGQTWNRIDSIQQHTALAFYSNTVGWTGGFNTDATTGGIFTWTGNLSDYTSLPKRNAFLNSAIYPNPVKDFVVLENVPAEAIIQIYDIYGKLVYAQQENSANARVTLDVADYSKGVYLLQINAGGQSYNEKIVIQ